MKLVFCHRKHLFHHVMEMACLMLRLPAPQLQRVDATARTQGASSFIANASLRVVIAILRASANAA
jgi:hypothetical protein